MPICIERFDFLPHLFVNPSKQFSEKLVAPFADGFVIPSPKLLSPLQEGLLCLVKLIWERERLEGLGSNELLSLLEVSNWKLRLILGDLLHFRKIFLGYCGCLRDLGFRHLNLIDYNVGMNIDNWKIFTIYRKNPSFCIRFFSPFLSAFINNLYFGGNDIIIGKDSLISILNDLITHFY